MAKALSLPLEQLEEIKPAPLLYGKPLANPPTISSVQPEPLVYDDPETIFTVPKSFINENGSVVGITARVFWVIPNRSLLITAEWSDYSKAPNHPDYGRRLGHYYILEYGENGWYHADRNAARFKPYLTAEDRAL